MMWERKKSVQAAMSECPESSPLTSMDNGVSNRFKSNLPSRRKLKVQKQSILGGLPVWFIYFRNNDIVAK